MIEFSPGYKNAAARRREEIEQEMTPEGVAVARGLYEHVNKASTPEPDTTPQTPAVAAVNAREVAYWRERAERAEADRHAAWAALHQEFNAKVVVPWNGLSDEQRTKQSAILEQSWRAFPPDRRAMLAEPTAAEPGAATPPTSASAVACPPAEVHPAQVTHDRRGERAVKARRWAIAVYGERARGTRYQAFRFLEEALELCQTQGLTFEDMLATARYVSARKVGETQIELGDAALCLDILAENLGLSVDTAHTSCLLRIESLDPAKCRAKDDAKCQAGLI